MDNSIYVTLARQLALFRDLDVTAGNLANANTSGYSAEHIMFDSYLTQDVNNGDRNPMSFPNDLATYRNLDNGALQVTGNPLDVAIQGAGYFQVETPLGLRYTRSGNFQLTADGRLVTSEGYPVLDASGQPIDFPDDTTTIDIGSAGNIKVNGGDFDNLGIFQFDNPQLLERLNGKLFKSDVTPQAAENVTVTQGMIEDSNVQPVMELTHMVELNHAVTDTAQFISIIYDLEQKAADTWAQQS